MWNRTKDAETHHLWLVFSTFDCKTKKSNFLHFCWSAILEDCAANSLSFSVCGKISCPTPPWFLQLCLLVSALMWLNVPVKWIQGDWNPLKDLWSLSGAAYAALPRFWWYNRGQSPKGRAGEITSQTPWGAPAVFREERAGLLLVAGNADRLRSVCGRGRMSSKHDLLRVEENWVWKPQELLHGLIWP